MYIIKNSYKSIIRAKGRNILIFILVFLIALSACVALSVRNSAESAKETAYNSLSITAQISTDRQGIMGSGNTDRDAMMDRLSQSLTLDELNYYAKSEYVDNFYYSMSVGLNVTEDFTVYETSSSGGFARSFSGMMGSRSMADLTIIGYSSHDAMTSFIIGENTIYEGSVFEQDSVDNSCVISYELAVLNELAVGDTIIVCNPSKEEQTYTLTICGIFQNQTTDSYSNTVFTTYALLDSIVEDTIKNAEEVTNDRGMTSSTELKATPNGTYVFFDVESYEGFCEDVASMGLDMNTYTVSSADINQYEKSVVPLESLSKFTMLFFIVVLLIGGGILVIFNIFTVRERKYEIGVLVAIGMKKGTVAVQFLIETFMITLFAIVIGTSAGVVASRPVGNYLLQEQIASVKNESTSTIENFGGKFQGNKNNRFQNISSVNDLEIYGNIGNAEYIDTLNTTTDISVLLSLMGISVLLTLVAGSVGMISVLRYEPLKILSER